MLVIQQVGAKQMLTVEARNHLTILVKTPHPTYIEAFYIYRECEYRTPMFNSHLAETNSTMIQLPSKGPPGRIISKQFECHPIGAYKLFSYRISERPNKRRKRKNKACLALVLCFHFSQECNYILIPN